MTKVDEYIATRIEFLKDSFGANAAALKRQCDVLWGSMSDEEKRETERRYFPETASILKARR